MIRPSRDSRVMVSSIIYLLCMQRGWNRGRLSWRSIHSITAASAGGGRGDIETSCSQRIRVISSNRWHLIAFFPRTRSSSGDFAGDQRDCFPRACSPAVSRRRLLAGGPSNAVPWTHRDSRRRRKRRGFFLPRAEAVQQPVGWAVPTIQPRTRCQSLKIAASYEGATFPAASTLAATLHWCLSPLTKQRC